MGMSLVFEIFRNDVDRDTDFNSASVFLYLKHHYSAKHELNALLMGIFLSLNLEIARIARSKKIFKVGTLIATKTVNQLSGNFYSFDVHFNKEQK